MADDITLTVRVRDMTHGDFQRLDRELNRMRSNLQGVNHSTQSAGMHARQLGKDVDTLDSKLTKMRTTGSLTRRELTQVKTTLEGMSRSALHAARSGEITQSRFQDLTDTISRMRGEFHHLGADLDGASGKITSVGNAVKGSGNQGTFFGKVFGNMRSKLIGVAVILGASLLPTIGALAPMLAGLGGIAGVAALAFSGLNKPTKQLSASQKEFIKNLKPLKKDFDALRKAAQDAVLPRLTKSFGNIHTALKDLNPVVKIAGDAFGSLVDKIAKGISSKDFMGPFTKNVKMGTDWVIKFAGSFGKFTKAFFDFGTKSGPALSAWQDLLGGFLDRGLPGMFTSMESGIKGASLYLKGLSSLINDGLLPGLGKLLGKFMEAFGPSIGDILRETGHYFLDISSAVGQVFDALAPAGRVLGHFASSLIDLSRISFGTMFDTLKEIGGGLLATIVESFSGDQVSGFKNGLTSISTWVQNNEGAIRDAFTNIGHAAITMTSDVIQSVPAVLRVMKAMAEVCLTAFDVIVSGADAAFGWLPGIGSDIHNANKAFDDFHTKVTGTFDSAIAASQSFADKAKANLSRANLSLNVDTAKRNIEDIKSRLQDPQLTKERKAKLTADMSDARAKLNEAQRKLNAFDNKRADATLSANAAQFSTTFSMVNRAKPKAKSVTIRANSGLFWSGVNALVNRTLGTSYINVQYKKVDSSYSSKFAMGGRVRHLASGGSSDGGSGPVSGPGTGMSDSVPAMLSNGEYVIRASSVRKYGQGFLNAVNSGTAAVKLAAGGMASGGTTAKQRAAAAKKKAAAAAAAEKAARSGAAGDLSISHFGKMAGYKNDEFRTSLGKPDALSGLVDSLNQWRSIILKATHGGVEKSLLKSLDKAGKSLLKYDKSLAKVDTSLAAAKTKLDDLKSAAASLKESVISGVMSATDITRNTSSDKNLTVSDLLTTMTQGRDQASAFAQSLKDLKSKGVSKDIINQISQAGISGGGLQTAGALLSASSSQITTINSLQDEINTAAKSAGQTASDAMYAAGIKAADGLVKGLTKKKSDIEKAMMNIAKSMEKAIKKALGIKSPSKVMQRVGHYTAEGFAVGVKKNQRVDSAWESMLTTGSSINGGTSSRASGSQQPIQIYVGGKFLDEIILDSNRRTVRTRGGNVQAVFGRKNS